METSCILAIKKTEHKKRCEKENDLRIWREKAFEMKHGEGKAEVEEEDVMNGKKREIFEGGKQREIFRMSNASASSFSFLLFFLLDDSRR